MNQILVKYETMDDTRTAVSGFRILSENLWQQLCLAIDAAFAESGPVAFGRVQYRSFNNWRADLTVTMLSDDEAVMYSTHFESQEDGLGVGIGAFPVSIELADTLASAVAHDELMV